MDRKFERLQRLLATICGGLIGCLFSGIWLLAWLGVSWVLAVPPVIGAVVGYVAGDRGIYGLLRGTSLG